MRTLHSKHGRDGIEADRQRIGWPTVCRIFRDDYYHQSSVVSIRVYVADAEYDTSSVCVSATTMQKCSSFTSSSGLRNWCQSRTASWHVTPIVKLHAECWLSFFVQMRERFFLRAVHFRRTVCLSARNAAHLVLFSDGNSIRGRPPATSVYKGEWTVAAALCVLIYTTCLVLWKLN